ncbi:MAG: aspartyl protease family protein, partial [Halioglobus sp.]
MSLAKIFCLLLVGMVLGWLLHDAIPTGSLAQNPAPSISTPAPAPAILPSRYFSASPQADSPNLREQPPSQVSEPAAPPSADRFRQLLVEQQFEVALSYYEQALSLDDAYQLALKPILEHYLMFCLEQCSNGVFVEVVNVWLSTYYQDIPVLLLLAEHQRLQRQPEEAASTLQLAATYAYQTEHEDAVNAAVLRLVQVTDDALSRQESWVELLGFYEYLETIDLGTREFLLREAILYRVLGETQRSQKLLLTLQQRDNKSNTVWTATLNQELSRISPQLEKPDRLGHAVAVTKRGDHFLVEVTLNRMSTVKLLIDTGASLTTLSHSSFADLPQANFNYLGSRMFNTAGGLTRGDIYRASSIELGEMQLNDIDIAVIDYPSASNVDGLLGMNVLRNYRFEIDQDDKLL